MQKRGPPSAETDDSDRRQRGQVVIMNSARDGGGPENRHYQLCGSNLKARSGYNVAANAEKWQ
jgi:hypothetical protein